ncbi:MAG: FGGY-family carbohydrate kinase [Chloroflexi bacterium]|nr:FGGY-family carbohydrate kinase [Chloroflexota bacterium]
MKRDCVVALDAGSGSGRTVILDLEGNLLGAAAEEWTFHVPADEPFGSEFDPGEMWTTLARTTRRALSRAGIAPDLVCAISATSQRDGVVFLDAQGKEVHCSTNRDARGVLHAEEIARQFGELIYRTCGRWPLGLDAAARLWWFRIHRPEVYARIARIQMISDWLIYRLCGCTYSEPTNASSSLLFDVSRCQWSEELVRALDFATEICPPCASPGTVAGTLTPQAAKALSLPVGIPVAIGAGDSQAACLGCAAFDDGTTTVIAGTTLPVQMVLSAPVFDALHRVHTGAYVVPDHWVLESNGGIAGAAYRWFSETFAPSEAGGPDFERLEREAATATAGGVMAVLGPQVADFSSLPFPPPSLFVFPFVGALERPLTRGMFARAVLENVAYATRGNVEQLEEISGRVALSLNLCGGLTHSATLVQIVADVCNRPVRVPLVREASSVGAAICAAVGAGAFPDLRSAAQAMVHWEPLVEPDPSSARRYRGLYRKWLGLFEKARGLQ